MHMLEYWNSMHHTYKCKYIYSTGMALRKWLWVFYLWIYLRVPRVYNQEYDTKHCTCSAFSL